VLFRSVGASFSMMSFQNILTDPASLRTALFCLAAISVLSALLAKRIKEKRNPEPRVIRLTLDSPAPQALDREESPHAQATDALRSQGSMEASPPTQAPYGALPPLKEPEVSEPPKILEASIPPRAEEPLCPQAEPAPFTADSPLQVQTSGEFPPSPAEPEPHQGDFSPAIDSILALQRRSPVTLDILRGALIMAAIVVVAALLLVLMPQSTVDRMGVALQPRNAPGPPPEKLAFLYLGDEVKDNQFHIRGVVRNISAQPIEQLQATVRLYAPDRTLLETQVVRMDSETVFPNATASFHLSFSEYRGQFGSYSLDFKLAQGDAVPYKDVREARASS
jgi:hypothetical protein